MAEHLVVYVDRLVVPASVAEAEMAVLGPSSPESPSLGLNEERENKENSASEDDHDSGREDEPLIEGGECRICQEEDTISNLEVPCGCSGSLKFAHRKCVQRWCNEKGDIICEICHQTYRPGYTAPPPPSPRAEDATIDIGAGWTISSAPLDLHNPRLLAIAQVERQFLEADYDEYGASGARAAAFCRSAILILMALLFLRHAWSVSDTDDEDDMSTFFSPFIARATGLLLPCYIVAWAICSLQRRRQRQNIYREK